MKPIQTPHQDAIAKTNAITMDGKYTTRSGLPVELYRVCPDEIHGSYLKDGLWHMRLWTKEGKHEGYDQLSLIPVKRKAYVWTNGDQLLCSWYKPPVVDYVEVEL